MILIKLDKQEAHWLHCSTAKQENCIYGHLRRADTYDYFFTTNMWYWKTILPQIFTIHQMNIHNST